MAQPDRETVYAALFSLLQTNLGSAFGTYTRRFISVTNTVSANAPYLVQVQAGEKSETVKGMPTLHTYTVHLLVYVNYGVDESVVPDTTMNSLVSSIETAVGPSLVTGFQQLGIPVSSVLINGPIDYANMAAISGQWAIALVPVEIVANY